MTIGGAISDLNNLLKADDMPIYYKPSIKKIIETIEQEPCEDAVSREVVVALAKDIVVGDYRHRCIDPQEVMELPPVTPKPKIGKWIKSRDRYGIYHFTCPFCENDIATKYAGAWGDNYCSDCGAKMEGE